MGPNSVIYGFVARGPVVLAGRNPRSVQGHLKEVGDDCLQKLSEAHLEEKRLTYTVDGHTFLFLTENGFIYSVLVQNQDANFGIKQEKLFVFLNHVMEEFSRQYGAGQGGVADTAREYGLEDAFGPQLRKLISAFHVENPSPRVPGDDRMANVDAQVREVKSAMMNNIEKMIDRDEKIDVVVKKTEDLQDQAEQFKFRGGQLRRKLQWRNYKATMIVVAIIIVLILIIFFWACHGVKCTK